MNWIFAGILLVFGFFILFLYFFYKNFKAGVLPYKKKEYFFNKSEKAFFLELKKTLPENYHIFSKVRVIDFIDVTDKKNYASWRNKIWAKHVDFLICDFNFKPVLAIEINGSSHQRADRIKRDEFIKKVYASAGLRFEIVKTGENFSKRAQKITAFTT